MPTQKEYQGIQIGGSVPQRILGKRDLSGLWNMINIRNQRYDEAIKQKSAIDVALGNLKLNAAEDKWKYDYARKIQKRIDDAATMGDYGDALDTAVLEAGKAVSSPEVMGRIRANEAYEKKKQEVESRNDISDLTRQRWLDQNKYHYKDTYDNEGNIIGGTEWNAGWSPVSRVEITKLAQAAAQIAAPYKGSTSTSKSGQSSVTDQNGLYGEKGSKSGSTMLSKSGGSSRSSSYSYQRLPEEKIREVFDTLWKADNQAMLSLEQDYQDLKWKVEKLTKERDETTDEVKRKSLDDELVKYNASYLGNNNQPMTEQEYMLSKVNPLLHNMAYNYVQTASSVSNNNSVSYGDTAEGELERASRYKDGNTKNLPSMPQVTTSKGAPTSYGTFNFNQEDSTSGITDLMQQQYDRFKNCK